MQGSVPPSAERTIFHAALAPASIEPAEVTFLKRLRPAPQPSGFGLGKFKLPDPMLDIAKLRAFAARPC